ncbi:MAG: DUF2012 domain-containing protein [Muribaculaceae bacterium]|nr:DUF2012 domain-containing protein [Muribaculaceae bacterium]
MTEGSIAGSVSDRTTGEPVATVNVTLSPGGNSTVTGSDGSFDFRNLEPGSYTLTINKEGYKQNSTEVYVKAGDPTSAHLLIERIPGIVTADRETLDFGENQSLNTLSFNIVNSSYEDLAWEIEERCEWITEIKPEKGTLAYGKTEGIVVVIDRDKLNAGENKAVIVIRSSQGSSQMNVTAVGTERILPKLNTLPVTDITYTEATFNGEIMEVGTPSYTERGFVYSFSANPTVENTIAKLTCTVTSNKQFSVKAPELTHSSTYYVRAYAINAAGVAYSTNEVKFSTEVPIPEIKTLDVVNADFSSGTATFRGEVTFAGDPAYIERGFVYGTLPEPTVNDNVLVANGAGETGTYSKYVTGLPKSTYYVRAYAKTSTLIVYGEEKIVEAEWIEIPSAGIAVQKTDLGIGNWKTADAMCKNSTIGGYTDWRLPTKEELMVLFTNRDKIGSFKVNKEGNGWDYTAYWSSSYYGNIGGPYSDLDAYYVIYFSTGKLDNCGVNIENRVRAVRTISK